MTVKPQHSQYVLGIGLSGGCNYKCVHCYYHDYTRQSEIYELPLDLLSCIFSNMPKLQSVILGLEGEPLLYPDIFTALDICAPHVESIKLITNGSKLSESTCQQLTQFPISALVMSIDAATKHSYENIRRGGNFNNFIKNSERAVNKFGNVASFHAVVFAENSESLKPLPKLASELGIKHISFQQLRQTSAVVQRDVHPMLQNDLLIWLEYIIEDIEKYDISVAFDSFFGNSKIINFLNSTAANNNFIQFTPQPYYPCKIPYYFTSILSNGSLFPCCGNFQPMSIKEYTFDGIFNHPCLQRLRYLTSIHYPLPPCIECRHLY